MTIAQVRKAIVAAVAVATTLLSVEGIPDTWKGYIVTALGILAAFGITYAVPNAPRPEPVDAGHAEPLVPQEPHG